MVEELLAKAGVTIGGSAPQDIQVYDKAMYGRVLRHGSLGLGEAYMDGQWDANDLAVFIEYVLRARLDRTVNRTLDTWVLVLQAAFSNLQGRFRARQVAKQHYDLTDILPSPLLDPYNQYTCAYFDQTTDLDTAQDRKLDLICRKLRFRKEDRVLDIGCGWGGLAKYIAEHYGCHVTGISISEEQIAYAKNFCAGLPVDIQFQDYRDLTGQYDKIVCVGMIEHVGYKNYKDFFRIVRRHLAPEGLFLLHTIGDNRSLTVGDPFLHKYIFPNGQLPSLQQITASMIDCFTLQDQQNLAHHYTPTLKAWHHNMQTHWQELAKQYDERFRRMFEFYLLSCAGAFHAGAIQHWQLVFAPVERVMDYRGPR